MRCPYHRSDFCQHGGQTQAAVRIPYCTEHMKPECEHPATDEPAPVVRCACEKRATVTVTYLPRPLPLFGSAVTVSVCESCYPETVKRGQLLGQQAIAGEGE
jgi:hypothetical protein